MYFCCQLGKKTLLQNSPPTRARNFTHAKKKADLGKILFSQEKGIRLQNKQ